MTDRSAHYPAGQWDAMKWAEEFVRIVKENPEIPTDVGTMLGWFANALMTGYDRGHRDIEQALEAIRLTQEYAQLPCVDGWSWWDFYRKHRPEDAARLKQEYEAYREARWFDDSP